MLIIPINHQACSTWALSGDESSTRNIHDEFSRLTSLLFLKYESEVSSRPEKKQEIRQLIMKKIAELREPAEYKVDNIYLCAAYASDDDIVPSHYWIEDHKHGFTTDTFINRGSIVFIPRTGTEGKAFQPGCESSPVPPQAIMRIKIDGYTKGQIDILSQYHRPQYVIDQVEHLIRLEETEIENLQQEHDDFLQEQIRHPKLPRERAEKKLNEMENLLKYKKTQLSMLKAHRDKPPLPEDSSGKPISVTSGKIAHAMKGALEARKQRMRLEKFDVTPERTADVEPKRRALLRRLNSGLACFSLCVSAALVTSTMLVNAAQARGLSP